MRDILSYAEQTTATTTATLQKDHRSQRNSITFLFDSHLNSLFFEMSLVGGFARCRIVRAKEAPLAMAKWWAKQKPAEAEVSVNI